MTDLMSELEAVVGEMGFDRPQCYARDSAYALIKKHHAEIAAAVRDAARYRWLRDADPEKDWDDAYRELGGCGSAEHVDAAIDQAMHNSAREG